MPPIARRDDLHICPVVDPPPSNNPHLVGKITGPCASTVLVDNRPIALVDDLVACQHTYPSTIVQGSMTVFCEHKAVVRVGDMSNHGGVVFTGSNTLMIND